MVCIKCGKEFYGDWRKSKKSKSKPLKYCSLSCSNSHRLTPEVRAKISAGVKKEQAENPRRWTEEKKKQIGRSINKDKPKKKPSSILEVSSRTAKKIALRMNLSCCLCGWNEAACDLHHIFPSSKGGSNSNSNLTNVCPNCHRKIHSGLIRPEDLIPLSEQIGDKWLEYYYV